MATQQSIRIYYDGECPFCSRYVEYIRFKDAVGEPVLINLREDRGSRERLEKAGYDVDKGMVVEIGEQVYYGKDAVNKMATLSTSSTRFNQLNHIVLSSPIMAAILYPIMVFCRNLTLELLGQRFIKHDTDKSNPTFDFFKVFAWVYAVYSILHFGYITYYTETIAPEFTTLTWLFYVLAIAVMLRPWGIHLFSLMVVVRLTDMWLQMPMTSNHAIIDTFLLLTFVLTGIAAKLQRYDWNGYVRLFAPAGRWLLIIMYVFGIFHKINTDFLNPESSCAVALWVQYPFPNFIGQGLWAHYLAIYGTFIVEGLIMIGLVFKKTRYIAVVMGMGFHLFLGLSANAFYGPFSMFSFALHTLFLPEAFLAQVKASRPYQAIIKRPRIAMLLLFNWAVLLYVFAYMHNHQLLTMMFVIMAVPILISVIQYAKEYKDAPSGWDLLKMGPLTSLLVVLYFLNNWAPYMGLKTHQSLNMFSSLHIDATRTNHLVITQPPTVLPFLKDVVTIEEIVWSKDPENNLYAHDHMDAVYHDLLGSMKRLHKLEYELGGEFTVTYIRDGVRYENVGYAHFENDIKDKLLPAYIRKVIHFEGLDRRQPRPCTAFR